MVAGKSTQVWDKRHQVVVTHSFKGAKALSGTLDNAAAVDQGGGLVRVPMTAHGFLAGSWICLVGSTNYDGMHLIIAVAANTFDITAPFVAETFAGTEFAGVGLAPGFGFKLHEARLHFDAAPTTPETLTITLDSALGVEFDVVPKSVAIGTNQDWDWAPGEQLYYDPGDVLKFAYTNTDVGTWGLEIKYLKLA